MSIFVKPLSQLEPADLDELLKDSAVENVRLEFKSEVPDKDETLKKLSSFANSYGGFLVVGAKANSASGRIEALPGVDEQAGYKQKIVQWCFDAISPPLAVAVSEAVLVDGGKFCYVIYVAESDVAPHFLNGRKGVWVRTDEFSQRYEPKLATESEIRHLLNRRQIVQQRRSDLIERSRRRFETLRSRQAKGPTDELLLKKAARLELSIGPRFPVRPVCEQARIVAILEKRRVSWRGTTLPYPNARFLSQHESVLALISPDATNRAGLIEATIWAMLFYGIEIEVEIGPQQTMSPNLPPIKGIHFNRIVGYLLVFSEHANGIVSDIGYEGQLLFCVTVSDILGVPFLYPHSDGSILDNGFSFTVETTTEELREQRDAIVKRMLQEVLFAGDLAEYARDPARLDDMLKNGYGFAYWPLARRNRLSANL